ncbi:MAG: hypothetical protein J6W29_04965 [Neisseriaceae bacterium]|nr:hypothetical protein [Neisseriaceae bacterium]
MEITAEMARENVEYNKKVQINEIVSDQKELYYEIEKIKQSIENAISIGEFEIKHTIIIKPDTILDSIALSLLLGAVLSFFPVSILEFFLKLNLSTGLTTIACVLLSFLFFGRIENYRKKHNTQSYQLTESDCRNIGKYFESLGYTVYVKKSDYGNYFIDIKW